MHRKIAVIDIGSNSVRLMFVADGKILYKDLEITRLGEGLAASGVLSSVAIQRSALAVQRFAERAKSEGAEIVCAFATAAVRSAKNGGDFVSAVKELCGVEVDVISGEEEAEIGILGALGNRDGGVIDIGGASTEIVVKKDGALIYKKSVNIGVVRLKDMCGRDRAALERVANEASKQYGEIPLGDTIYAIGGTATTLTAQVLGLQTYTSDAITGAEVSVDDMQALTDKLLSMSVEEIAALPCMPKGRADVLTGGAVLFTVLMKNLGFTRIIASDRDNLEGYAIKKGLME